MITLDSIDSNLHSIQIKDAAGDALAIGADGSLNVTDNGGSLTVDGTVELGATTLAALESITVQNGAGAAAVNIQDGGNSLTVDAVDLDIRNLVFATDKVDVSGSEVSISSASLAALESITVQNGAGGAAVNIQDGGNSLTVDAVDLDIRDLSHAQDSVKIGDGTDFLAVNADGSINVQSFEGAYASWSVITASVGATESQLAVAPLSGRLRVEIQNLGDKDVYIRQATGVTTANGLKIPKGSSYEQALDAGAAIYAIASGASADLRIAQYAA